MLRPAGGDATKRPAATLHLVSVGATEDWQWCYVRRASVLPAACNGATEGRHRRANGWLVMLGWGCWQRRRWCLRPVDGGATKGWQQCYVRSALVLPKAGDQSCKGRRPELQKSGDRSYEARTPAAGATTGRQWCYDSRTLVLPAVAAAAIRSKRRWLHHRTAVLQEEISSAPGEQARGSAARERSAPSSCFEWRGRWSGRTSLRVWLDGGEGFLLRIRER
jgi:hypothetical protein